jgi:hypothetical protein
VLLQPLHHQSRPFCFAHQEKARRVQNLDRLAKMAG